MKKILNKKIEPQSITRARLEKSITDVVKQIAETITYSDTNTPITNSKWTIGDAAAHLVISQNLFKKILEGSKSPYGKGGINVFSEVNDKLLKKYTDREGYSLAKKLINSTSMLLAEAKMFSDDQILNTHFGEMDLIDFLKYCLCHLLMHGSDISIALKKLIPVNPNDVNLILPFFKKGMTEGYDKENAKKINLTIDMNIKGVSRFVIICKQGKVTVENKIPKTVDSHVSVDPVTFFLVSTGILPIWKPLLKGKILIWGKKPWLVLKLKILFPNP